MTWFVVWTTLVLATLAGGALLGRDLWRKGTALLAQLKETSAVADQLQTQVSELERLAGERPVAGPTLVATPEQQEGWREVRRSNRDRRIDRRHIRQGRALARWRRIGMPL